MGSFPYQLVQDFSINRVFVLNPVNFHQKPTSGNLRVVIECHAYEVPGVSKNMENLGVAMPEPSTIYEALS